MSAKQIFCYHCQKTTPINGVVGRRDECPVCRSDLHVCRNCQHYDPKSYNECKEPQADRVVEKDRSNFCDFFSAKESGQTGLDLKAQQLAAAEALFKKK